MSGYCLECGNDLCICSELEEEAKKQPDVVFICQRKEIEKLQEQNKILREALDFYSKTNHWLGLTDKVPFDITKWIRIVEDDMDQNNIGGKRAREALAKVK